MLNGLTTAFRTLSIIPVPGRDATQFSDALYGFPIVGFVLGAIFYSICLVFEKIGFTGWSEATALLLVRVSVFLTRGFHLDGLADFADGFWGGYDRERTLAIMKDSFLGTFGVLALILLLLAKWIALNKLIQISGPYWIGAAYLISRTIMVDLIVVYPYARKEGTAGPFIKGANWKHWVFAMIVCSVLLFFLLNWVGLVVMGAIFFIAKIYGWWCGKKVGGITGDLLGAFCEMSEVLVLFIGAGYIISGI